MKKVLIVTYYWPPSGGAGVQRWLKFSKYLPELGWQPIIYTPENPEVPALDESLLKEIPNVVIELKTKIWEPYSLYKIFTKKSKNERVNAGFIQEKKSNSVLEKLAITIRGNLFIPDARKFWIKPSIRYLNHYLNNNPVDVIVSTGPPHSMHLIALAMKRKFNIPWIADFRDPWTDIDFYGQLNLTKWADKKHRKLEKKVLQTADKVITIGKTSAKDLTVKFNREYEIITNGYDEEDFPLTEPIENKDFSLVHAGAMNKDRNHPAFWDAISELIAENSKFSNLFRIKLIGKVDNVIRYEIEKRNLNSFVEFIPYLSHKDTISELYKAGLLYLPVNNTPNAKSILTGKFFEYLACKRPILSVGPVNGDIANILSETNAGTICDFNDKEKIKKSILNAFIHKNKKFTGNESISNYSRKYLTKKLANILLGI
ncbi:MAG: glycosyltransferase family 4 protein [Chlorobi bacterium]|nr:glycosyltransferase family 4 protein [Chlorobiota bacterium]